MKKENKRIISAGCDVIKFQRDVPTPPPPGFTSPFNTIQEWLFDICDGEQPQKLISEFCFLLFESPGDNLLCLVGYNTYKVQDIDTVRVDFTPSNMFFPLSQIEYQSLLKEQVRELVVKKLIEFTNTSKFQNSFLSKARSITTNFVGKIWPS